MASKVYIDVYYYIDPKTNKEYARTVAGLFKSYQDPKFEKIVITRTDDIAEYEPGNFYKRELPPILDVLKEIKRLGYNLKTIIVDGFVHMAENDGTSYHAGLGKRLEYALQGTELEDVEIIGVAKHPYSYMFEDTIVEYEDKAMYVNEIPKGVKYPKKGMYITSNTDHTMQIAKEIFAMPKLQKGCKFSALFTLIDHETKKFKHDN